MKTPKPRSYIVQISDYRRKRKWGWAFTYEPTGEGTNIATPTAPMHTGTLKQVRTAIANDAAYQPRCGTFCATAWFWRKERITNTWAWTILESGTDLTFDPATSTYAEWTRANTIHRRRTNIWGWGWVAGFHPPRDTPDVKIRVV